MSTTQPMPEAEAMLITHHRAFNEMLNGRNLDLLPQLCTQDYRYHGPGGVELEGVGQLREMIEGYLTAFPDLHMTVEHRVVEGDLISTRWTATGTHDGPLAGGVEPTQRRAGGELQAKPRRVRDLDRPGVDHLAAIVGARQHTRIELNGNFDLLQEGGHLAGGRGRECGGDHAEPKGARWTH